MASFTLEIPNDVVGRVVDGIAYQHKYQDELTDPDTGDTIPNPETKAAYSKRMLKRWVRENVKAWEATQAAQTAASGAANDADSATDGITVT